VENTITRDQTKLSSIPKVNPTTGERQFIAPDLAKPNYFNDNVTIKTRSVHTTGLCSRWLVTMGNN
jgi:hypothetical protein